MDPEQREAFPAIDDFIWTKNPEQVLQYLVRIPDRFDDRLSFGSVLPLELGRLSLGIATPDEDRLRSVSINHVFEGVANSIISNIACVEHAIDDEIDETVGIAWGKYRTATHGWHYDYTNSWKVHESYNYKLILTHTRNPLKTTRFAPRFHPIRDNTYAPTNQIAPAEDRIVRAKPDTLYLLPFYQTVHDGPGVKSGNNTAFFAKNVKYKL
jgi:hypothetical protein